MPCLRFVWFYIFIHAFVLTSNELFEGISNLFASFSNDLTFFNHDKISQITVCGLIITTLLMNSGPHKKKGFLILSTTCFNSLISLNLRALLNIIFVFFYRLFLKGAAILAAFLKLMGNRGRFLQGILVKGMGRTTRVGLVRPIKSHEEGRSHDTLMMTLTV